MFQYKVDEDIKLKMLEEKHGKELFFLVEKNRVYLREWLPWLDRNQTEEDSRSFIRNSFVQFIEGLGITAGIFFRDKLVGVIGIKIDKTNNSGEIGYWLDADHQGNGIVTKACREIINYAFGNLGLNRIVIRCATGNRRSQAIPERLGFIKESILREAEFLYDHYEDLIVYSILKNEWNKK